MSQITKRQHFVPRFYLEHWCDDRGELRCHDLMEKRDFPSDPRNVLAQNYFYEENRDAPDNRVENVLAVMEGALSGTFDRLSAARLSILGNVDGREAAATICAAITVEDEENIKSFAALQYMRVPGAITQKSLELRGSNVSPKEKCIALNPGRFVESGYRYVMDRFADLKLHIFLSSGREFITSDWPCFDMKDSDESPSLGEEIGRDPHVLCYIPLNPALGAVLYHPDFRSAKRRTPSLMVKTVTDQIVRNQNTLVIQRAERFVVAPRAEQYIFRIAAKRKKRPYVQA